MLKLQTLNSCFVNQLPMLKIQTVAFLSHPPYIAGTNSGSRQV